MRDAILLPELIALSAERFPERLALTDDRASYAYGDLQDKVWRFRDGLMALGINRGERVAIYLEKRLETIVASFGAPAAGAVFVPLNPLLKADQVAYILRDCNVRVLVTSPERLRVLQECRQAAGDLRHVVVLDSDEPLPEIEPLNLVRWGELLAQQERAAHRVIDTDVVSILYTSGSTGRPKGTRKSSRSRRRRRRRAIGG